MGVTVRDMLEPVLKCKFLADMDWAKFKKLVIFLVFVVPTITTLQLWGSWAATPVGLTPKAIIGLFMSKFGLARHEVITFLNLPVIPLLWNKGTKSVFTLIDMILYDCCMSHMISYTS